jgi:hypothetical protein
MNKQTRHTAAGGASGASTTIGRTALFLLGGLGVFLLGAAVQPRTPVAKVKSEEERILFPELSDAAKAASLDIVSFDEALAAIKSFKVAQADGVWVLPAHESYPADAKDQLAAAATELIDRPLLDEVTKNPGDHEQYGVLEPDPEKVKVGSTGVGRLIEIRDASGNKLARLIVGKEVDSKGRPAGGGKTLRYVRRAGQDPVYRMQIDLGKFSTTFTDWIEKDLLKLSPWDLRRLTLDDSRYALFFDETSGKPGLEVDRRSLIELAFDDKDSKWTALKLQGFDKQAKPVEDRMGDDEELATAKLNDLKNALGDLKIIDVRRKPAGLSGDLKAADSFAEDDAAVRSLGQRGFYAIRGRADILSSGGETVVGLKDGVEYVLRFGNATSVAGDDEKEKSTDDKEEAPAEKSGRYLFVTARFNEGLLEKPKLDPLPEVPAVPAADGEKKPDGDAGEKKPADAADKPEGDAGDKLKAADEAEAKAQAALEERRRVERENRRREEDYDSKVKGAQKRVRELNGRFADWYYVVSDAEYAKIHLGRADVVQKKAVADKGEAGTGAAVGKPGDLE